MTDGHVFIGFRRGLAAPSNVHFPSQLIEHSLLLRGFPVAAKSAALTGDPVRRCEFRTASPHFSIFLGLVRRMIEQIPNIGVVDR
jgi:hypothetical protein